MQKTQQDIGVGSPAAETGRMLPTEEQDYLASADGIADIGTTIGMAIAAGIAVVIAIDTQAEPIGIRDRMVQVFRLVMQRNTLYTVAQMQHSVRLK